MRIQEIFETLSRLQSVVALISRVVLDLLITPEKTKGVVTLDIVLGGDFVAEESGAGVLEDFEKQRLMRREMRGAKVWYELMHERLVPSILDWFKLDKEFTSFAGCRRGHRQRQPGRLSLPARNAADERGH